VDVSTTKEMVFFVEAAIDGSNAYLEIESISINCLSETVTWGSPQSYTQRPSPTVLIIDLALSLTLSNYNCPLSLSLMQLVNGSYSELDSP